MADFELDADPQSTWGQTEEYKAAWHAKYGNVSPKASASKAEWEEFATKNGMSASDAQDATRDDLIAKYGASTVVDGASVANDEIAGQGEGTSAEGNVASDPAKRTATNTSTGGTATR